MATSLNEQLIGAARGMAIRGLRRNEYSCTPVKSKDLANSRAESAAVKAKLASLTAEDGTETEVAKCSFTRADGQAQQHWVIAKISSRETTDGFDIHVNASALSMGRRGKELGAVATNFKVVK